jgi:hypothetical protein
MDNSGKMEKVLDAFTRRALGVLTSSAPADALDVSQEDPRVRERYGKGDPRNLLSGRPAARETSKASLDRGGWWKRVFAA